MTEDPINTPPCSTDGDVEGMACVRPRGHDGPHRDYLGRVVPAEEALQPRRVAADEES